MLGPQHPFEPAQPSVRASPGQPGSTGHQEGRCRGSQCSFSRWLSHARMSVPLVQGRGWGSGGNQRAQPQTPEQERERGEDIRELSSCFLTVHSQPKLPLANRKHLISIGWMDAWMHGCMDS